MCLSHFGSEISLPLSLALHVCLVLKIAVLAKEREGAFVQDSSKLVVRCDGENCL